MICDFDFICISAADFYYSLECSSILNSLFVTQSYCTIEKVVLLSIVCGHRAWNTMRQLQFCLYTVLSFENIEG